MDDEKKSFLWTLGITSIIVCPQLLIPLAAGGAAYGAFRVGKAAAKKTASGALTLARRMQARAALRRADAAWQRGAPERERLRLLAAAQAKIEQDARRRREDMRTRCELLYLHYPTVTRHLPRSRFEHFLKTRMGEDQPADKVEERGRLLQHLVRQLGERQAPAAGTEQYLHWCREQMLRTAALPLDETIKRETMTALERSLVATEHVLRDRDAQVQVQGRLDLQVAEFHRQHETNLAALRTLQGAIDHALLEDLLEAERRRFRNQLLDFAEAGGARPPDPLAEAEPPDRRRGPFR